MVSNLGDVYSLKSGKKKKLKPGVVRAGYHQVVLTKSNVKKSFKVHRLVMLSFHGPSNLLVNHKDYNRKNNRLDNLEYVSHQENRDWSKERMPEMQGESNLKAKMDWAKVLTVYTLGNYHTDNSLAEAFDIDRVSIGSIRWGKKWSHLFNYSPEPKRKSINYLKGNGWNNPRKKIPDLMREQVLEIVRNSPNQRVAAEKLGVSLSVLERAIKRFREVKNG